MKRAVLILMSILAGPGWLAAQTPVDEQRPAAADGVVEIENLAPPGFLTRMWMSKYLVNPNQSSLILPVRDWMAFRAELDESLLTFRRSHNPTIN